MRRIQVLGFEMRDWTVRESLHLTGEYLNNGILNVVYFYSLETLAAAEHSEELQNCLENADITIPATPDVLKEAGNAGRGREQETEKNLYLKGLLRILSRNRNRVFLIADDPEKVRNLKGSLCSLQPDLDISGTGILDDPQNEEGIINEINEMIPDVIFVMLSSSAQGRFTETQRSKINAKLLLAVTEDILHFSEDGTKKSTGLFECLRKRLFGDTTE